MEKIKGIIDRFEGDIAVVEIDGMTKDYNKALFPKEASVGDVIEIEGKKVTVFRNETEKLRKEIEDLMNDVWEE